MALSPLENPESPERSEAFTVGDENCISARLCQLGDRLAELVKDWQGFVGKQCNHGKPASDLGGIAERIYTSRRKRDQIIYAGIFGEPSWDILLDLFISECKGRQISVTSACIASAVPSTTALRWITILLDADLVERRDDPADRRKAYLQLSAKGRSAMEQYLRNYGET